MLKTARRQFVFTVLYVGSGQNVSVRMSIADMLILEVYKWNIYAGFCWEPVYR